MRKLTLNQSLRGRWLLLLFALLLSLPSAAQAEDYGITIAGVQVTSDNASSITGANITSGTVSFNPQTNILTLDNVTMSGNVVSSIENLNVKLVGVSTFNIDNSNGDSEYYLFQSTITTATLTFSADQLGATLQGYGTSTSINYNVNLNYWFDVAYDNEAYWSSTTTQMDDRDYCQVSKPYVTVDGSAINEANKNNPDITGVSFDLTNNKVTLSGFQRENQSYNSYSLITSNIANLNVDIQGGLNYIYLNTKKTNEEITSRGFVYTGASGQESSLNVTVAEGSKLLLSWSGETATTNWLQEGFSQTNMALDKTKMQEAGVLAEAGVPYDYQMTISNYTPPVSYGITVGGVEVTSENASDILSDDQVNAEKVSYNAQTNTLTLNGVNISGYTSTNGCITTNRSALNIAISGNNTLDCSSDTCTTIRSTLQGGSALTFVKGGDKCSLTLKGGHAIRDFASVTVSSGLYWDDAYTYEMGTTNFGSGMSLRNPVGQETYSTEATNAFLSDAQPLGLTVGGVEVTTWNASNVMNDDLSEEGSYATVVFDATTNTLTLHYASLDMSNDPATCPIESSIRDLKVKLKGYNRTTIADGSDQPHVFRYTGEEQTASLTLLQEADEWGSFGSLNASGVEELGNFCPGYTLTNEIREVGNEITGWEYSIEQGYSSTPPSLTISYTEYYDIWIGNARLTSSNRNGGHSGDINYNDENHTLHLGGIHYSFVVKSKMPALTIELANNNDISGVVFEPTDVVTSGTLTFSKCADSKASENMVSMSDENGAIVGFSSVTVESPLKIAVPATAPEVWDANTKQAIISDASYYDLKVNGEYVTSSNANNVTGGMNDDDRPQVTYNPDTNTLTLDNASLTVYNGNAIDFGVANLKVNFVGESNITVYDYDEVGYAAFNSTLANNTITFTTSATEPGSLFMMLQNPVANATASYENGLCSWANGDSKYIKQLNVPYLSVDIDDSQYVLNIASSDNPDGTKHYYSIDYADASIADVPDTEAQAETGVNLLGACTVTAYAKYGDYQSMNAIGKLFGFASMEKNTVVGQTIEAPEVIPALGSEMTVSLTPDETSLVNGVITENEGVYTAAKFGTATFSAGIQAEPADIEGYEILNPDYMLGDFTANVVPVAPTVDPEEDGTYSTNTKVTMFSDYVYNDPQTAAIKYYLNDAQSEQLTYQDVPLSFEGDVTIHAWVEVQNPTNATVHKSDEVVRTYTFKPEPTLAFSLYDYDFDDNYEFSNTYGDQFDEPELKVTGGEFQVTYSSSNTNVATVDSSTGEVTIKSAGKTTITATVEETDEHFGATRSYQLRVTPKIEMTENCILFPGQTISVQVSPEGATVKYGINEEAKTDYTGAITVNGNMLSQHDIHVYVNATFGEGDDQVESNTSTRYFVYDRPTVSVPAGTYNDTQHVQISNLPQRDGGYPKVYYYFNDAENDATLYENDAIIDIVESTMLKYYIFEEETLQYKSIPIAAEYTVIPKTQLNISYASNSRQWASYYADEKSLETPEGLQANIVTAVSETGVSVSPIDYIPQNVPILLKRTAQAVTEPIMAKAYQDEETADVSSNKLAGTAENKAVKTIEGNVYVLYNDGFTRATSGSIPAHRAYLVIDKDAESRLFIWEDEDATRISTVGRGFATTSETLYNLNGQRVSQPSKGLYISNGKKRIVK